MPTYQLRLQSPVSTSYRCTRAANSVDIDVASKLTHEFKITADIETPFALGVLVGASGSVKTTLATQIYGPHSMASKWNPDAPVLDQFPASYQYEDCVNALTGIGLTAVTTWLRPMKTLSNGQRARAEAALAMAHATDDEVVVIDEWTSVVDRTVAKVMSHCLAKYAKKTGRRIVLLTCHYDVLEWLDADWIIDCNEQTFQDRRTLSKEARRRREQLTFTVKPVHRATWAAFSKYHYLSSNLPGGFIFTNGLFHNGVQIGFQCLAEYMPWTDKSKPRVLHSNRLVIHPDYAGLGLGALLSNACCAEFARRGFSIYGKFSSAPVNKARARDPNWTLLNVHRKLGQQAKGKMLRDTGFRTNVTTYQYRYIGPLDPQQAVDAAIASAKK